MVSIIAAIGKNNELGLNNNLIWHLSGDMKFFKTITTGKTVIMGRKCFESLPNILPNRKNIIITSNLNYKASGATIINSIKDAITYIENSEEDRTPAYLLFAVPEETHLLLRKALYLEDEYDVELVLIPNTATLTEKDTVTVSSHQIEEFINSKTEFVSVDDLPNISDQVTEEE